MMKIKNIFATKLARNFSCSSLFMMDRERRINKIIKYYENTDDREDNRALRERFNDLEEKREEISEELELLPKATIAIEKKSKGEELTAEEEGILKDFKEIQAASFSDASSSDEEQSREKKGLKIAEIDLNERSLECDNELNEIEEFLSIISFTRKKEQSEDNLGNYMGNIRLSKLESGNLEEEDTLDYKGKGKEKMETVEEVSKGKRRADEIIEKEETAESSKRIMESKKDYEGDTPTNDFIDDLVKDYNPFDDIDFD